MSLGRRRNAAVMAGLSLLVSLAFAGWEQRTSGTAAELLSVHFPEGTQVGYAVGTDTTGGGAILKTTDGGNTWVPQTSGVTNGVYSVYFEDDSTGFAVSGGTLLRTTDGGATWNPTMLPGMQRLNTVQFPQNGQIGYITATPQGGGGKLFKTTDGGDNWTATAVGGAMNIVLGGSFATDSAGVIFGAGGFLIGTIDGGGNFAYQGPQTAADLVAAAFSPDDPYTGYLVGNDSVQGYIRYTATGGFPVWDSVRCYSITACYGVDVPTTDVAYTCGAGGRIDRAVSALDFYRTTVPMGVTVDMHDVCFPNGPDTGYAVGAGGTILRTYDGGAPWMPGVAEGRAPTIGRAGIRVVRNPSRHGITFRADADVSVSVFDAAGRVAVSRAATKGLSFLPLSKAGAYFVRVDSHTIRVVVTD